jgi:hypothetical protein
MINKDYIICPTCKGKMIGLNFSWSLSVKYSCNNCVDLIGLCPYISLESNSNKSIDYILPFIFNNEIIGKSENGYFPTIIEVPLISIIRNNLDINAYDIFTRLIKLAVFL